jgi:hypothetical protein
MVIVLFHFSNAMCHAFIHDKSLLLTPLHFELYSSQEDEGMQKEVNARDKSNFSWQQLDMVVITWQQYQQK